jgi:hypothetical protein
LQPSYGSFCTGVLLTSPSAGYAGCNQITAHYAQEWSSLHHQQVMLVITIYVSLCHDCSSPHHKHVMLVVTKLRLILHRSAHYLTISRLHWLRWLTPSYKSFCSGVLLISPSAGYIGCYQVTANSAQECFSHHHQ